VPTRLVKRALTLPELAAAPAAERVYWREERVQRGDTIGSLLTRADVDDARALTYMRTNPAARPLYQLRPGRPVRVAIDDDGRLLALRFVAGNGDLLAITRSGDAFAAASAPPPVETRVTLRAGEIRSSLFGAADDIGLPDAVTLGLAEIFAGDIDFYHDLRRGDRFSVLYETRYVDGEAVGTGRCSPRSSTTAGDVIAVSVARGPTAPRATTRATQERAPRVPARSPVEFSRITSGFTPGTLPSDPADVARAPRHRFRGAHRYNQCARPRTASSRWPGAKAATATSVMVKHGGTYSSVTRTCHASLRRAQWRARAPGRHDRLCRGQTAGRPDRIFTTNSALPANARNPMTVALPTAFPRRARGARGVRRGDRPAGARARGRAGHAGARVAARSESAPEPPTGRRLCSPA
jgi:hypothetical protein